MTKEEMIQDLLEEITSWDEESMIEYIQEHYREVLEKLSTEEVREQYDTCITHDGQEC
jgi:hypothetical protein